MDKKKLSNWAILTHHPNFHCMHGLLIDTTIDLSKPREQLLKEFLDNVHKHSYALHAVYDWAKADGLLLAHVQRIEKGITSPNNEFVTLPFLWDEWVQQVRDLCCGYRCQLMNGEHGLHTNKYNALYSSYEVLFRHLQPRAFAKVEELWSTGLVLLTKASVKEEQKSVEQKQQQSTADDPVADFLNKVHYQSYAVHEVYDWNKADELLRKHIGKMQSFLESLEEQAKTTDRFELEHHWKNDREELHQQQQQQQQKPKTETELLQWTLGCHGDGPAWRNKPRIVSLCLGFDYYELVGELGLRGSRLPSLWSAYKALFTRLRPRALPTC